MTRDIEDHYNFVVLNSSLPKKVRIDRKQLFLIGPSIMNNEYVEDNRLNFDRKQA